MIDHALRYAARGWKVFPCIPLEKKPLIKDWQLLATTNKEQISRWWTDEPHANIGVLCGTPSGIAVIDVDVSEKGNGFRELEALDIDEWETHYQQTPRGGRHFFFTLPETPVRNAVGFFGQGSCVDVRGEGGYVLLAPSVTDKGTYTEYEGELDTFPHEFLCQTTSKPASADLLHIHVPQTAIECQTRVEEARAYARVATPAVQGEGGHSTLLKVARELVWGYVLKADEAIGVLWQVYNSRCAPPWDANKRDDVRDLERKVYEAFKFPPPVAGYRLSVIKHEMDRMAEALLGGRTMDFDAIGEPEAAKEYKHKFEPEWEPKIKTVTIPKGTDPTATMYRDFEYGLSKLQLSKPPGIVGDLAQHITETACKPQPFLALGAALTAQAAVMGRLYRDVSNTRTNLYCIGIAPSSSGKDHPTKMIDRLFVASQADDMVGGSDLTSDTALINALNNMRFKSGYCMIWDECGHIISNIKSGANGGAAATIIPVLMKLYSSAADMFRGKMKAKVEEQVNIYQPHVCLWGVTTNEAMFDSLTASSLRDGFLGRILPFLSDLQPEYSDAGIHSFPPHIVEHFTREYEMAKHANDLHGMPKVTTIPEHPEATKMRMDFAAKCEQILVKLNNDQSFLWGKAHENCRKIALTIAGGCEERMITPEIMHYSIDLTRLLVIEYQKAVDIRIFETSYDREIKGVYEKAKRKFGNEWFSRSDLCKITQHLPPAVRGDYRDDLLDPTNGYVEINDENRIRLLNIGTYAQLENKKNKRNK